MPRYDVACPVCGIQEVVARMSEAAEFMPCPICERPRPQVLHVPYHVEDRTHMWKGPMGNGWSTALGEYMPESRQARDRLAREKGVEFISKAELLASNKEAATAVEYQAHVQAGGPREEPRPASATPWQSKPAWTEGLH